MNKLVLSLSLVGLLSACSTPNLVRDCTEKCSSNGGMTCESVILGGNNPLYACKARSASETVKASRKDAAKEPKEAKESTDELQHLDDSAKPAASPAPAKK